MATTSKTAIPIITIAAPSTVAASLAPIAPLATTLPVTTEFTIAGTSTEKTTELVKAMEEMSIQATELKRLKEKVASLETDCKLAQKQQKEEAQKALRMGEKIKVLEKVLTLQKPLGQTKEMLWANSIDSVNDILPSIQVIFEQIELVKVATEAIKKVKEDLGDQTEEANQLIHFLNSKNMHELNELGVEDIIEAIIKIKKVLSKRNLMLNLEKKCHNLQVGIDRFMAKLQNLRDKGLPNPMVINDKLMTQLDYVDRLEKLSKEQASTSGVKALPTEKVLYDTLENIFFVEHEVKHLFVTKPNFSKYS